MKDFKSVASLADLRVSDNQFKSASINERHIKAVNDIWEFFARLYGHKFTSSHVGDEIDFNLWSGAIEGLKPSQVKQGIEGCKGREWPPSINEFRMLCLNVNEKDKKAVFKICINWNYLTDYDFKDTPEFRRSQWIVRKMSDDGVYYEFRHLDQQKAKKLFAGYYEQSLMIDEFESVVLMIEEKKEYNPKTIRNALKDIRKNLYNN